MTDRPEVLLSFSDHLEDVKIRWQIHQYEVYKLREDLSVLFNAIADRVYYISSDQ
jgi:hypothetical protein